ncbi:hypothetical protein [Rhodococcus sp. WB9]|uniref:hypothetical protein n=1 Tax=Rhodococcus sp. WB9 TaxID=2594007 RepID=UPI0021B494CF|nr:hypothetical protein [Rhodococcus sp. WB9]
MSITACTRRHRRLEPLLAVVDELVRSEGLRTLHGQMADTARGGMDQHALPAL